MGRWRSVAETIDRRFLSARERPGAGFLPILAPGRLRGRCRSSGGSPMSLWRRAPRQVYRVYGEDEYLAEEHVAADAEFLRAEDSHSYEKRSELGGAAPPTASRTPRLVGIGLLLGVTVGAAGLVLSHLSHEASTPRVSSSGPSVPHRASGANSGSVLQHTSGVASADSESATRSKTSRASVSRYRASGSVARSRMSGSVAAAGDSYWSRQSTPARTAGPLWRSTKTASMPSDALVYFAASGGEFEFER